MPRNITTGVFTRVSNSFSNPVYGTVIDPTDADALFDDFDGGMTFNDSEPLMLVGSTSGALTILAPDTASGAITLPAGTTDFSATGGTGQFVKQASAGAPFTVATVPASEIASPAALTRVDDTNVTLTLGGAPSTALLAAASITAGWTGTLAAGRLNANVVQAITNDTNVTGSIAAQNLTLGWTGTLAAGRLNANVVQSVVNDTNVTGSISAQALTLGWSGTLANARLASTAAYTLKGNFTGSAAAPQDSTIGALTQKASPAATDLILIQDQAASGQLKYAEVSAISAAGSVASIAGNTGAFTLSTGITNSTNDIRLAAKAAFRATKGGTDQTGVLSATNTLVTFGTEEFDTGTHFASNRWTPPSGLVTLSAGIQASGTISSGARISATIFKNGAAFAQSNSACQANLGATFIGAEDRANGTDFYELYIFIVTSSGNATVLGSAFATYFSGAWLSP